MHVLTYNTIKDFLGNKDKRKIGNNTYVLKCDEGMALRLHHTDIITYYPDGSLKLSNGGFETVTTRDRFNYLNFHGYYVETHLENWYLRKGNQWEDKTCPLYIWKNPMHINAQGECDGELVIDHYLKEAKEFDDSIGSDRLDTIIHLRAGLESNRKIIRSVIGKGVNETIDNYVKSITRTKTRLCIDAAKIIKSYSLDRLSALMKEFNETIKDWVVTYCIGTFLPMVIAQYPNTGWARIAAERLSKG